MGTLAYFANNMVPRLCIPSASESSWWKESKGDECAHCILFDGAMAWGRLDICHLGSAQWALSAAFGHNDCKTHAQDTSTLFENNSDHVLYGFYVYRIDSISSTRHGCCWRGVFGTF